MLAYLDAGEITEGELTGYIYIVTELCPGGVLSKQPGWGTAEPSGQALVAEALLQMAEGLTYLHRNGWVHRDVKPGNVLQAGDTWKLADFGLTRHASSRSDTETVISGTPAYMAPELFAPEARVEPAADVYALGVVAHYGLTGTAPYAEPGHVRREIAISPDTPEQWRALVEKCLQPEPGLRPPAASIPALLPTMPAVAGGSGPTQPGQPTAPPGPRIDAPFDPSLDPETIEPWQRRAPTGLIVAGIAALLLAVAGIALLLSGDGEPEAATPTGSESTAANETGDSVEASDDPATEGGSPSTDESQATPTASGGGFDVSVDSLRADGALVLGEFTIANTTDELLTWTWGGAAGLVDTGNDTSYGTSSKSFPRLPIEVEAGAVINGWLYFRADPANLSPTVTVILQDSIRIDSVPVGDESARPGPQSQWLSAVASRSPLLTSEPMASGCSAS